MNTQCPYCNAPAGVACTTAAGNEARQPHAARTQTTEETATQTTIDYDFHATASEEDGYVSAHLTEHPEKTYDPNALMVAATLDGGWEVFGSHKGSHVVSADFQTITHAGRQVSADYREHAHAIHAAKAGAKAIQEYNAAQTTGEDALEANDVRAVARDLAARGLADYRVHESELTGETVATLTDATGQEFMIETCAAGVWHDRDDQGGEGHLTPAATVWEAAQAIANVIEVAFAVKRANEEETTGGAFLADESDKNPKHDPFTYHVIFDADSVDNADALPAAQEGRWLLPEVRTYRHNSYNEVRNLLRNIYGAKNPRPVALMRLQDGQSLGWDDQGLATAHA